MRGRRASPLFWSTRCPKGRRPYAADTHRVPTPNLLGAIDGRASVCALHQMEQGIALVYVEYVDIYLILADHRFDDVNVCET